MKRGRRPGAVDTRSEIIEAARAEFAEFGYDNATLRGIARRAGVDPALIHHYFTDKSQLFELTLDAPEAQAFLQAFEELIRKTPREQLGSVIVQAFFEQMDDPEKQEAFIAMARASLSLDEARVSTRRFLGREVLVRVIAERHPDYESPELRATMITGILYTISLGRFITQVPVMRDASVETLTRYAGPMVQFYLDTPVAEPRA